MFNHVDYYPGDPILGLNDLYNKDTRAEKVNLGVGVYYDEDGNLPLLDSVLKAEAERAKAPQARPYLPMSGLASYNTAVQRLLFGADSAAVTEGRIATIQSIGGSGALRVGAEFVKQYFPQSKVYVSKPTWGNHISIFEAAGLEVGEYPYYDAQTGGVKFDALLEAFKGYNKHDVVLLHPCCHNPTGVDLTPAQWDVLLDVVKERELLAFMDIAYQGFGDDFETDVYAIRKAEALGLSYFVSSSFSKNLSFYGERLGALSVVSATAEEKRLVFSQLQYIVRRLYSNPPCHPATIASDVLNSDELFALWTEEVAQMRVRIKEMRQRLFEVLTAKVPGRDFSYITAQRGMFSFSGLSPEQVARLASEFGIYLVSNGRMCVAGLNTKNIDYVANAFVAVLQD
ncbi:aromatic amino acid transaminase [Vitreoscilla stercoraria]|uniref:Aminotransferase n=1 Tax=Vitreoscilla stercoraria TaxID=61 RepID=A0ABY4EB53_VITST|nr:amino acid aminotransferase [Vitreoscilla stercoraria]UOO92981.1 aspartate/tyrosine/aromatic aminotransferase [Vitreoscilla stercoraria]